LDDFLLIYDELNDNVDTYVDRKNDLRKALKVIVDADTEFQAKLRAIRDAAGVTPQEAARYEFVMTSALDTVDSSADEHRKLMAEQEETKHRKKSASQSGGRPE
jgi:gamma-glutamyl phosphate reductase